MDTFTLKVITPERVLYEGEVTKYVVKCSGQVGEFAVLPHHAPMASIIGLGSLLFVDKEGTQKVSTLFGGYALVEKDCSTIVTEIAEWPEEIDLNRAEASKQRAEDRLKQENVDQARAYASLMRALSRINVRNHEINNND